MPSEGTNDHSDAIGRQERQSETIAPSPVTALAATFDMTDAPQAGDPLPPGWHWLYFNPFVKRSEVAHDGHLKRGDFMPDISLPRRMWAGGRLTYHKYLTVGEETVKDSEITNVVTKSGRAGQLVFVTIRHLLSQNGTLCVEEEQDIVYREAPAPGSATPTPALAPDTATQAEVVTPDPVLLFRYSALTSNGHRIHYDRAYAQNEEGYRDLIVHGPLTATLLQGFATRNGGHLARFEFRGTAPLFVDRAFTLESGPEADGSLPLWVKGPEGELAMQANAVLEARS